MRRTSTLRRSAGLPPSTRNRYDVACANSRPMQPGDVAEVEVSGLGRLSNTVQSAQAPAHRVGHEPTDADAVQRVALGQF
jgi:hypothetical protein